MNKSKYHSGEYKVKNGEKYLGKKNPTYRSSWELKFCEFCDNHPNVMAWASETLTIKYRHPLTKKVSTYIPDFFVVYMDEKGREFSEIVEVKPYSQTNPKYAKSDYDKEQLHINAAKWKAAIQFAKKMGVRFRVITEVDIFKNTKYSKNIKNPGRRKK